MTSQNCVLTLIFIHQIDKYIHLCLLVKAERLGFFSLFYWQHVFKEKVIVPHIWPHAMLRKLFAVVSSLISPMGAFGAPTLSCSCIMNADLNWVMWRFSSLHVFWIFMASLMSPCCSHLVSRPLLFKVWCIMTVCLLEPHDHSPDK